MTATRLAAETLRLLPRKRLSRAIGKVAARTQRPALLEKAIGWYVRAYDVDLSECVIPEGGFRTFNEFFTRPLKEGARPLDPDPAAVLSPADGKIEDCGDIDARGSFRIKGKPYTLEELLGSQSEAARLAGGRFVVVYLSPRDYHRVHAPVGGEVVRARHLGGTLFPVNRIGVDHVPGLFAKNERVVIVQDAVGLGEVVTVLVGALVVGGIGLSFDAGLVTRAGRAGGETRYAAPRPSRARGEELGWFELGSTAIVFLPPSPPTELVVTPGTVIQMGRAIARRSTNGGAA
ncbi:MAG: archaetidylserine decarboxylase [Sandaracinus sp.]